MPAEIKHGQGHRRAAGDQSSDGAVQSYGNRCNKINPLRGEQTETAERAAPPSNQKTVKPANTALLATFGFKTKSAAALEYKTPDGDTEAGTV